MRFTNIPAPESGMAEVSGAPQSGSLGIVDRIRKWHLSDIHRIENFNIDVWLANVAATPPSAFTPDQLDRWNFAVRSQAADSIAGKSLRAWLAANAYTNRDEHRAGAGMLMIAECFACYGQLSEWDITEITVRRERMASIVDACEALANQLDALPAHRIPNFENLLVRSRLESQPHSSLIKQNRYQVKVARELVNFSERPGRAFARYNPSYAADHWGIMNNLLKSIPVKPSRAPPKSELVNAIAERRESLAFNIEGRPVPDWMLRLLTRRDTSILSLEEHLSTALRAFAQEISARPIDDRVVKKPENKGNKPAAQRATPNQMLFVRRLDERWRGHCPASMCESKAIEIDDSGCTREVSVIPAIQLANCLEIFYPTSGGPTSVATIRDWLKPKRNKSRE